MALSYAMEYLTYEDYAKINDGKRYELIDGVLYNMASPSADHQRVTSQLWKRLDTFLEGRRCEAFIAPFDVRLNADKIRQFDKSDNIVFQPDVLVLCDKNKLDPKGKHIKGAPDLIIEVLSPSSVYVDRVLKHRRYMEAGVREYWIVDPQSKTVSVYILENGKYYAQNYGKDDKVPVHILSEMEIDISEIFPQQGEDETEEHM